MRPSIASGACRGRQNISKASVAEERRDVRDRCHYAAFSGRSLRIYQEGPLHPESAWPEEILVLAVAREEAVAPVRTERIDDGAVGLVVRFPVTHIRAAHDDVYQMVESDVLQQSLDNGTAVRGVAEDAYPVPAVPEVLQRILRTVHRDERMGRAHHDVLGLEAVILGMEDRIHVIQQYGNR
jgi:hypothetical protein